MKKSVIKILKKSNIVLYIVSSIFSLSSYLRVKGKYKNTIQYKGAFLKNTRIILKGRNNIIKIGKENRLNNCLLYISGTNCEINIDKHCILDNLELWIEDDGGKIFVGCRTTIAGGHIAATEGEVISIGEDCMFSHGIEIRNGDSHSIFSKDSSRRINVNKPVKIGSHVWLGGDVKVLKGSSIGDNSIISTGAIVTGGIVEPNTIYAGVPAKKVKENIYWERDR
jgi:acetyltransferase-like isoleucine patch superfamily enzyme